jgi:hypothetical protein
VPNLGSGWRSLPDSQDVVSKWVEATSVAPHTEEVARSVVDTLMQFADSSDLRQLIPAHVWLWLNERPSLPPVYKRCWTGVDPDIFQTILALNDIGILTSYLILIWSEWAPHFPHHFTEMRESVREDFNGIGMGCHRAELIQRLNYILGELDRREGRLGSNLEDDRLWHRSVGGDLVNMKVQYGQLKRILQEVEARTPHSFVFPSLLTLMNLHRIALHLYVCPASPVSMTPWLGLFPFHIIVVSMHSPRRFGTITILPRRMSLFFQCTSMGTVVVFCSWCSRGFILSAFCIIFVKPNPFSVLSASQQAIYYTPDVS